MAKNQRNYPAWKGKSLIHAHEFMLCLLVSSQTGPLRRVDCFAQHLFATQRCGNLVRCLAKYSEGELAGFSIRVGRPAGKL